MLFKFIKIIIWWIEEASDSLTPHWRYIGASLCSSSLLCLVSVIRIYCHASERQRYYRVRFASALNYDGHASFYGASDCQPYRLYRPMYRSTPEGRTDSHKSSWLYSLYARLFRFPASICRFSSAVSAAVSFWSRHALHHEADALPALPLCSCSALCSSCIRVIVTACNCGYMA